MRDRGIGKEVAMNYNFVQREVRTPVLATLTCVQQKLSALLSYIREST